MRAAVLESGKRNPTVVVETAGFQGLQHVYYNLVEAELYEQALCRGEAQLTAQGALRAVTVQHTGRSAQDKYVVRDAMTGPQIWWDNNKAMQSEHFAVLLDDFLAHAQGR